MLFTIDEFIKKVPKNQKPHSNSQDRSIKNIVDPTSTIINEAKNKNSYTFFLRIRAKE